jgi:hypothetical protein
LRGGGLIVIIMARDGVTFEGHTWRECISKNGDSTFALEVQSTDPEDNFTSTLTLVHLYEYMREGGTPFKKTVIEGGIQ